MPAVRALRERAQRIRRARFGAGFVGLLLTCAAFCLSAAPASAVTVGAISGTVTDATSAAAISGVQVTVYDSSDNFVAVTSTDTSGNYTVSNLPSGTYEVEFLDPSGAHQLQFYNNQPSLSLADPVTVTAPSTTAGVDAAMQPAGQITGTVTDAGTKAGIQNILVEVYDARGNFVDTTCTGPDGTYTIGGLASANYYVEFAGGNGCGASLNYLTQYYNNEPSLASADSVAVSAPSTTSGINAAMQPGGEISGTVKDGSATPIQNVQIIVFNSSGGGSRPVGFACTAADGTYTVPGLATGTYYVEFDPNGGGFGNGCGANLNYVTQYYNGQSSLSSGDGVAVTAGSTASGIDATMQTGGTISGTVTDATSNADLQNVEVDVFDSSTFSEVGFACTTSSGTYSVSGLATGSYYVEFVAYGSGFGNSCGPGVNYATQWYNGRASISSADAVAVTAGATTSNISAAMQAGGTISGTVTDGTSTPLQNVEVDIYDSTTPNSPIATACTAADGTYTVAGLAPATYYVAFDPSGGGFGNVCGASLNYIIQYYNGKSSLASATGVPVTAGGTASGISAKLAAAGSIAGTVTDASSSSGLQNVEVDVYDSSDSYVTSTCTASDGTYTVPGLAGGSYYVGFNPQGFCGSPLNYIGQYYSGKATLASADAVAVTAGSTTSTIDAALQPGGQITGTVTDATTHAGIQNVEVDLYDSSGNFVTEVCTGSSGTYALPGLTTGNYYVGFNAGGAGFGNNCGASLNYLDQFYKGASSLASGTAVAVTQGTSSTGVDAALQAGGQITGSVTDASSTSPIQNVEVDLYDSSGNLLSSTCTAADGTYTLSALATGTYYVGFTGAAMGRCGNLGLNYIPQFYNGKSSLATATAVSVTQGSTTPSVDAAMEPGGRISGTVTDASTKGPVANAGVTIWDSTGNYVEAVCTASDGTYVASGLPSGSYHVEFNTVDYACSAPQDYVTQYYNDQSSLATADAISVTTGATTPSVNAALQPGGSISGTVTDSSSSPLSGVHVTVYDSGGNSVGVACTASDGTYTIEGLAPGTYHVGFVGATTGGECRTSVDYATQYYNNETSLASADPVTVTANTTTGGIDASLAVATTSYALNVSKNGTGSGTVTSSPSGIDCGSTCSSSFNSGTQVTLSAAAASGSTFAGWSGGGCSGTGTCKVTMSSAQSVTATFNTPVTTYLLSVSKTGTGSGTVTSSPSGIDCGSTCSSSFNSGTQVTLSAAAASGSTFAGWSGGGCSGTGTCKVTMNAAEAVTAEFSAVPPPPKLALNGAAKSTGAGVKLTLKCAGVAGQRCAITLILSSRETLRGKKLVAVAARKKTIKKVVVVGRKTATLAAGQTATLLVSLNPAGRKLLAHFKKLPVQLKITSTVAGTTITVATQKLTIKKKR